MSKLFLLLNGEQLIKIYMYISRPFVGRAVDVAWRFPVPNSTLDNVTVVSPLFFSSIVASPKWSLTQQAVVQMLTQRAEQLYLISVIRKFNSHEATGRLYGANIFVAVRVLFSHTHTHTLRLTHKCSSNTSRYTAHSTHPGPITHLLSTV